MAASIRTFHLTGVGENSELEPLPGLPLWPALTTTLINEYRLVSHYPVILHSSSDGTEPTQCVSLLEILQGTATGSDGERLGNQEDIEQLVGEIGEISERSDSTEISTVVAKALQKISSNNGDEATASVFRDLVLHFRMRVGLLASGRIPWHTFIHWRQRISARIFVTASITRSVS